MGLLGNDSTPDFNVPDSATDMEHAKFLDSSLRRSDHDVQSAFARSRDQLNSNNGLMPTVQNYQQQDAALARQTSQAQINAIHTKGENLFSRNVQKMAMDNQMAEFSARSAKLAQDFQLSSKQTQIFETIKQGRLAAERARIASRNAVLGQVFGTIGAIVGTLYGGAAGGMAGGAAGKGLGDAMSGSQDAGPGAQSVLANSSMNSGGPRSGRNDAQNGMGNFNDRMNARKD